MRADKAKQNRKKSRKGLIVAVIIVLIVIALGAAAYFIFFQKDDSNTGIKKVSDKLTDPLTGEEVDSLLARPIQFSIDNAENTRPQEGLSYADIVFEYPVEGSITRLQAIFYSQLPDVVGPVRSARPYFVDTAREYKAVFVNHGWSPAAKKYLESGVVPYISGLTCGGGVFYRATDRPAPHNSMVDTEKLQAKIKDEGYDKKQDVRTFNFLKKGETVKGTAEDEITINYLTIEPSYKYDKENNVYKRYVNGEKYTDKATGKQITAANVLIQYVDATATDAKGRLDIDMTAGGKALLFRKGKMIKGT